MHERDNDNQHIVDDYTEMKQEQQDNIVDANTGYYINNDGQLIDTLQPDIVQRENENIQYSPIAPAPDAVNEMVEDIINNGNNNVESNELNLPFQS